MYSFILFLNCTLEKSYSAIQVSSPLLAALNPVQCCGMEVVGTEPHHIGDGVIHRRAMDAASQWILVTTEQAVQCMSGTLEGWGGGEGTEGGLGIL